VAALEQAGREIRDPNGAHIVILVFGQLSSRTKVLARWLAGDDAVQVTPGALNVIAEIMKLDPSVSWASIRPRLRLIEVGSIVDLGAAIDLKLASCYSSPADRLSASDALRELVAVHSDVMGTKLQPIDRARLAEWLTSRGLPAISPAERSGDEVPVLVRKCERYLQGVERIRGAVPEIPRDALVEQIVEHLVRDDVVLVGGGGSGKTELEAQVVRRHLSDGWVPIIIHREDLVKFGGDLAHAAGAGGRTDLPGLVGDLLSHSAENLLVVVDGIDEIRRTAGTAQAGLAAGLLTVLNGIRAKHPERNRLHLLISCRRFDWSRMAAAGWNAHFASVESPPVSADELAGVPEAATEFRFFVDHLQEPLRTIALSRPILLRMAHELWLQRHPEGVAQSGAALADITSEVGLWRTYYDECVCGVDIGLVSSLLPGDVMKCHDEMARRQVEDNHFTLLVPSPPIEMNHPRAFPWLRSVEVAVDASHGPGVLDTRFFHPSYADFALALVAAEDGTTRRQWAQSTALSVSLYPVWRRVPSFWLEPALAVTRICDLLLDGGVPHLTKRALLEGYFEAGPDGNSTQAVSGAIAGRGSARLLADFIKLATAHALAESKVGLAESWIVELRKHEATLDIACFDDLLRAATQFLDANSPTERLRSAARELARVGFERATQVGRSPSGLHNARILARHSAAALSRALSADLIRTLPIKVDDWTAVGDLARATTIAADVRQVLVDADIVRRMHEVDADATLSFLVQIIVGIPPVLEGKVDLGTPQQTSPVNMSTSLRDAWEGSWNDIAENATSLFGRDKRYLQLSVLAWQLYGLGTHGRSGSETFPREKPGDYWFHDDSHLWWATGHHSPTAHVRLADAGFAFVEERAALNYAEPFLYLCAVAEEIRWAGLVGVLLGIAGRVLGTVPLNGHAAIAEAAAKLIGHARALHMLEIRDSAITALPLVAANTAGFLRDTVWSAVRELADLGRIADEEPVPPDLERGREVHARLVSDQKAKLDKMPDDSSHSWERSIAKMQLKMLAQFTPEWEDAMRRSHYEKRLAWRAEAARGEVPFGHPDVEACLAAIGEFFKRDLADLLPADLVALHAEILAIHGQQAMPRNEAPIRYSRGVSNVRSPSPSDTNNPRARFCLEFELLFSEHLNRTISWERSQAIHLLALIEDNRDKLGLNEPTPATEPIGNPDEADWHAQQPLPKRAWARLVLLYLEHLEPDEPSHLSAESIQQLLGLASDADPAKPEPAGPSLPYTVRGEAAAALFPLRAHGDSPSGFVTLIAKLVVDPAPAVRRAVYAGARWLRGTEDAVYAKILQTFSEGETDSYLVGSGAEALLLPPPTDGELGAWGRACVSLLARFGQIAPLPLGRETNERAVEIVGDIAVHLAVRGEPGTTAALRQTIASPAIPGVSADFGWAIANATIEHVQERFEKGRSLDLLGWYSRRSAETASMCSDTDVSVAKEELELVSGVAAVLAAALTGQRAIRQWTLTHEEFPSTPRRERMRPELRANEQDLRLIWRGIVDPWLVSAWCVHVQRMLLDAIRVAREVAHDEPGDAERMLKAWRLESKIGSLEMRVRDELLALTRTLLPVATDREWLITLLREAVESGHAGALELMKQLAQELRTT
jgi:hypothetical protein